MQPVDLVDIHRAQSWSCNNRGSCAESRASDLLISDDYKQFDFRCWLWKNSTWKVSNCWSSKKDSRNFHRMQFQVPGSFWTISKAVVYNSFCSTLLEVTTVDGSEIRWSPVEVKVVYPSIYRVLVPSQVVIAGFQPSTVSGNSMQPHEATFALGIAMGKTTGDLWYWCFLWWSRTVGCVPRFVYQFGRAEGIHKVAICQCFLYREGYLIHCKKLWSQLEIKGN